MRQRMTGEGLPTQHQKDPTVPARIAAMPEAANAVRMKSYSSMRVVVIVRMAVGVVIVAMRVALDVDVAGHHEIAILMRTTSIGAP